MSPGSSNANEPEPDGIRSRPLVVAIAHGSLRHWAVSELASTWLGRIQVVDRYPDVFRAFQGLDREPVLLICGVQLSVLTQRHRRRWTRIAEGTTVVLVESLDSIDVVGSHLSDVDAVLLWERHQGIAIDILRTAGSGIRTFPPEVVDRLVSSRENPFRRRGDAAPADPKGAEISGGPLRAPPSGDEIQASPQASTVSAEPSEEAARGIRGLMRRALDAVTNTRDRAAPRKRT